MSRIYSIKRSDKGYPALLNDLADHPSTIYWQGTDWEQFADKPRLAIVGSRKCSPYGRGVIETLVRDLRSCGVVIVSGLALGADSIAHRAALANKLPTVAVLPASLESIYPASHRGLARQIVTDGGALVSEYPAGTDSMKHHFIARNRLIATLSDAVLIPEAAIASGSLHTAKFALELGRDVLAVPGAITNPLSEGTNELIKHGATPVTSVLDILQVLGINAVEELKQAELLADSEAELALLRLIASGINDGGELYARSGLLLHEYQQVLSLLEIKGQIRALGSDHWSIK